MQFNIGITMRITNAQDYDEPRDTIAQDWPKYLDYLFPGDNYFFIPNIEEDAVEFCKKKNINLLIISGGDDLGSSEKRDNTELILLDFMYHNKIPVIGICRGMQLIHHYFGGIIIKGNKDVVQKHRATSHKIIIQGKIVNVNSYHNSIIDETTLHRNLSIVARNSDDNSIEAFEGKNLLGLMWHPERDLQFSAHTKGLVIKFLLKND